MTPPRRVSTRFIATIISLAALLWLCAPFGAPTLAQAVQPTPPAEALPTNQPERGLIYDGLQAGGGPCAGMYEIKGAGEDSCTHGPDPAPPGADITQSVAPLVFPAGVSAPAILCDGDGTTGKRTQVIYARASDKTDRYSTYLSSIRAWAAAADQIYHDSAVETGGDRRIRFVTDGGCNIVVPNVTLSATGDDTFSNTISQLSAQGYNRSDRKYMVFVDANVYCGIGNLYGSDTASSSNPNNGGPSYGRTDSRCWSAWAPAHEHMHNLGGVQLSAPYTSGGYHCVDEYDLMCYSDSPNYPAMQFLCPSSHGSLFDCNHNDYYSTSPPGGSYLATHWNAANSQYLIVPSSAPLNNHYYFPLLEK